MRYVLGPYLNKIDLLNPQMDEEEEFYKHLACCLNTTPSALYGIIGGIGYKPTIKELAEMKNRIDNLKLPKWMN
jgi:hypothetical protein